MSSRQMMMKMSRDLQSTLFRNAWNVTGALHNCNKWGVFIQKSERKIRLEGSESRSETDPKWVRGCSEVSFVLIVGVKNNYIGKLQNKNYKAMGIYILCVTLLCRLY